MDGELARLVEHVSFLVDEIRLVTLNLTVANARLRMSDSAFQAVGSRFRELLDSAVDAYETAETAVKRTRGEKLSDEEMARAKNELDANLEKIKNSAESIIRTVLAIKRGQGVDRQV